MFGRELSGNMLQPKAPRPTTMRAGKGMMLPPAVPDKVQRGGASMQWSNSNEEMGGRLFQPHMLRREVSSVSWESYKY